MQHRGMKIRLATMVFALGAVMLADPAQGQEPARPDEAALLRRRVVLLEDRVALLERQIAALEQLLRARPAAQLPEATPAAPAADTLSPFREDGWRFQENWRRLERDYSQLEVRQLLGKPTGIIAGDLHTMWYYPGGGVVRFTRYGERVEGWREPSLVRRVGW